MQRKSSLSLCLSAAFLLLAAAGSTPLAHAADAQCTAAVQNHLAWDYDGHTQWNPANVNALCEGSAVPAEPPRCFDKVMHGGVDTGSGTRWSWENALTLCAGTSYAANTVECFQTRIHEGAQFGDAIAACRGAAIKSAPANQMVTLVTENRTSDYVDLLWTDFNGVAKNYGSLAPGESRELQTFHGHTWQFMQSDKPLARIVAGDRERQQVVITAHDAGDGPIWSTADAQQQCPTVCNRNARRWNGAWNTTIWGEFSVCRCIEVAGPSVLP